MCLKFPDFDKVRLQSDQRLSRSAQSIPLFLFAGFLNPSPKQRNGHRTQTQRCQFHGFTGGIDVRQFCLGKPMLGPHLGQQPTFISSTVFFDGRRTADDRQWDQQDGNSRNVDDLATKRIVLRHLAISRVFKMK